MKITDVKLFILEQPNAQARAHRLVEMPDLHRIRYSHRGRPTNRPLRQAFIQVETDSGKPGNPVQKGANNDH